MFKYVRRILAASGLDGAFQAVSALRSAARIDTGANDTGRHQPDRLMSEIEELIAGSQSLGPVPRLVLCGEFSAGKSSIVNLMLGCEMLPTAVLPSTRRPVYIRHAPTLLIDAILEKGERERISLDDIKTIAQEDISHFEIGMPNALLRYIEVLDTPGFADPFHDPARTLDVIENADICVWCTPATQAWRRSERQTWLSLPARFRTSGMLVVTHADSLANSVEQQRVRTRLQREAGDLFSDIVFLGVPDAVRARRDDGQVVDPELWRRSGGSALVAALQKLVIDHVKARQESAGFIHAADAPRTSAGMAPADPIVATVAASPDALRRTPGTGLPDAPLESAAIAEPQSFLAKLAATVPACLAVAWIDLAKREVLVFYEPEPAAAGDAGPLGDAIADLFQGPNVEKIESLFRRSRGLAGDHAHYFKELFIITDECLGVFLRSETRADRALVLISDKTANLGMVVARARRAMTSAESLT